VQSDASSSYCNRTTTQPKLPRKSINLLVFGVKSSVRTDFATRYTAQKNHEPENYLPVLPQEHPGKVLERTQKVNRNDASCRDIEMRVSRSSICRPRAKATRFQRSTTFNRRNRGMDVGATIITSKTCIIVIVSWSAFLSAKL
jgi:hypothetical protein